MRCGLGKRTRSSTNGPRRVRVRGSRKINVMRTPICSARADRAEQIGVLITLIFRLPRTRTLLGPLVDERVLLPNPHLILEPHLDRGCQCKSAHGLQYAGWKAFF